MQVYAHRNTKTRLRLARAKQSCDGNTFTQGLNALCEKYLRYVLNIVETKLRIPKVCFNFVPNRLYGYQSLSAVSNNVKNRLYNILGVNLKV